MVAFSKFAVAAVAASVALSASPSAEAYQIKIKVKGGAQSTPSADVEVEPETDDKPWLTELQKPDLPDDDEEKEEDVGAAAATVDVNDVNPEVEPEAEAEADGAAAAAGASTSAESDPEVVVLQAMKEAAAAGDVEPQAETAPAPACDVVPQEEAAPTIPGVPTPNDVSLMAAQLSDEEHVDEHAMFTYSIGGCDKYLVKGTPIQAVKIATTTKSRVKSLSSRKMSKSALKPEDKYNPAGGVSGFLVGKTEGDSPSLKISQLITPIPDAFKKNIAWKISPTPDSTIYVDTGKSAVDIDRISAWKVGLEVEMKDGEMSVMGKVTVTDGKSTASASLGPDMPTSVPAGTNGVVVQISPEILIAWDKKEFVTEVDPEKDWKVVTAVANEAFVPKVGAIPMRFAEVKGMQAWYGPTELALSEHMVDPKPMALLPAPMGEREIMAGEMKEKARTSLIGGMLRRLSSKW